MKTKFFVGIALVAMACGGGLHGQTEPIKEKVEVVNVEVPVRVFLDGEPVAGLGRDDFKLYEGKEERAINGFTVRRKKLAVQQVAIASEASPTAPARYFVLVFRLIEYNEQVKKGVDFIFKNILRDNDRLLVMVNDRTMELNRDFWEVKRQELLEQLLSEEAAKARHNLEKYFLMVMNELDQTKLLMLMERDSSFYAPRIIDFLERYLSTWDEFKKKYLIPNLDNFYNFARFLEKIQGEKWVFNFYQIEMFPNMKIKGDIRRRIDELVEQLSVARPEDNAHARIISQLLERINRELNMADDFPVTEVGKMLVKVDTTYHSFIMGVEKDSLSEDLDFKKVASNIENSLRVIARQSGGEVVFSGNIGSALHSIAEKEDISYVLPFEPKNPSRKGKIRVEVANPRCQLYYDDSVRADYIGDYLKKKKAQDPTLLLQRLEFTQGRLHVDVSDFKRIETGKGWFGNLNVAVSIRDQQNQQLFDQNRSILAKEELVSVTIDFSWLRAGSYIFVVEVGDMLTEKTAMDVLQVAVD
jgi:hypothetical protein